MSRLEPGALISKLDANGNLIWTYSSDTMSGTQYFRTWSGALDAAGGVNLSGTISGLGTSTGFVDVFTLKLSEVPEPTMIAPIVTVAFATLFGRRRSRP